MENQARTIRLYTDPRGPYDRDQEIRPETAQTGQARHVMGTGTLT